MKRFALSCCGSIIAFTASASITTQLAENPDQVIPAHSLQAPPTQVLPNAPQEKRLSLQKLADAQQQHQKKAPTHTTLDELFSLMNTRLSLMVDVAYYKAINKLPIEDLKRETELLAMIKKEALMLQLNPELATSFVQLQFNLGKAIQHRYLADYLLGDEKSKVVPLETLRGILSQNTKEIFKAVSQQHGRLPETLCNQFINQPIPYLTAEEKAKLIAPLKALIDTNAPPAAKPISL